MKPKKPPVPKDERFVPPDGAEISTLDEYKAQVDRRVRPDSELADELRRLADLVEQKRMRVAGFFFIADDVEQRPIHLMVDDTRVPDDDLVHEAGAYIGTLAMEMDRAFRELGWESTCTCPRCETMRAAQVDLNLH